MNLAKILYNTRKPSRGKVIGYSIFYASLFLFFKGMHDDFIPSEDTRHYGHYISTVITVALLLLFTWRYRKIRSRLNNNIAPNTIRTLAYIIAIPLIPALIYFYIFLIFSHALPARYTNLVGDNHSESSIMKATYSHHWRWCDNRLTGDFIDHTMPSHLCIYRRQKVTGKNIKVSTTGRKSMLGYLITGYSIEANQSATPEPTENRVAL